MRYTSECDLHRTFLCAAFVYARAALVSPGQRRAGCPPPTPVPPTGRSLDDAAPRSAQVDELIAQLSVPLLLLWGEKDPWVVSALGDRAQACAEAAGVDVRRVSVDAGHCPQDEAPEPVNRGLIEFASRLEW